MVSVAHVYKVAPSTLARRRKSLKNQVFSRFCLRIWIFSWPFCKNLDFHLAFSQEFGFSVGGFARIWIFSWLSLEKPSFFFLFSEAPAGPTKKVWCFHRVAHSRAEPLKAEPWKLNPGPWTWTLAPTSPKP